MMPVPWAGGPPLAWRLDVHARRHVWDRGIGAAKVGGRWNAVGYAVVDRSADPSTAILEVAVHKGFPALDAVPHVLTRARLLDATDVHVVKPDDLPHPGWLRPGSPIKEQQAFGWELLERYAFVLIPSVVSPNSWNLLFNPTRATGRYELVEQTRFSLDTRLSRP